MSDIELSELWTLMEKAGSTIYQWVDTQGIATDVLAIKLGNDAVLAVSDVDGYSIHTSVPEDDLVPVDEYNDDDAIRAASDLEGYFGVVGVPGSSHHQFRWFSDENAAASWVNKTNDDTLETNPVLGILPCMVFKAADVFDEKYRDGTRVYFEQGFGTASLEPKNKLVDD